MDRVCCRPGLYQRRSDGKFVPSKEGARTTGSSLKNLDNFAEAAALVAGHRGDPAKKGSPLLLGTILVRQSDTDSRATR